MIYTVIISKSVQKQIEKLPDTVKFRTTEKLLALSVEPRPAGVVKLNGRKKIEKKSMEIQELKALIKESVREVLREERFLLCQALIPSISDAEQAEIEAEFGSPLDYDDEESVDMTDWIKHGGQISQASN